MNTENKVLAVVFAIPICLVTAFFGSMQSIEGCNILDPDIDTVYTPDFDQQNFDSLKPGVDTTEVIKLLGRPFETQQLEDSQWLWYYTHDGKNHLSGQGGDYAWQGKEIFIRNGKVEQTQEITHYD